MRSAHCSGRFGDFASDDGKTAVVVAAAAAVAGAAVVAAAADAAVAVAPAFAVAFVHARPAGD